MTRKTILTLVVVLALLLAVAGVTWAAMSSPSFRIISDTAQGGGAGGGVSTSTGFRLEGSSGGAILVSAGSSSYQACSGFICATLAHRLFLPLMVR